MAAVQQSDTDEFIVVPKKDVGHGNVVSMVHLSFAIRVCHGWPKALHCVNAIFHLIYK